MNACLFLPPGTKPFSPSYVLMVLNDILLRNDVNTIACDLNVKFYDYIYSSNLNIKTNSNIEKNIVNHNMDYVKSIFRKKEKMNIKNYEYAYNNIKFRNFILNKIIDIFHFSFFSFEIKQINKKMEEILKEALMNIPLNDIAYNLIKEYLSYNFDICFITVMDKEQLIFAYLIASCIKKYSNECQIVVGGSYINLIENENKLLKILMEYIDIISTGDAEIVFKDIVNSYRYNKKVICNSGAIFYENNCLKKLSKININNRHFNNYKIPQLIRSNNNLYFYPILKYPVLTSRGCCYGKCLFCTDRDKIINGIRIKRVTDVVNDVINLSEEYNILFIEFIDNNMHARYLNKFSKYIVEKKQKIIWCANTRFYNDYLDIEVCNNLYKSGCRKLFLGLETYNQDLLDKMNKGILLKNIIPILSNLKKSGIITHISIMFGFIGETVEHINKTKRFIYDNKDLLDFIEVNLFVSKDINYTDNVAQNAVFEMREWVQKLNKNTSYLNVFRSYGISKN